MCGVRGVVEQDEVLAFRAALCFGVSLKIDERHPLCLSLQAIGAAFWPSAQLKQNKGRHLKSNFGCARCTDLTLA